MSDVALKRCTGACGRDLPATPEYWYQHKGGKYGLSSLCKQCTKDRNRLAKTNPTKPEPIKQGYKRCTGMCGKEYPSTTEYFRPYTKGGSMLRPRCKKCLNAEVKAYQSLPDVAENKQIRDKSYRGRADIQAHRKAHMKAYQGRSEIKEHRRIQQQTHLSIPEKKDHHSAMCAIRRARKKSIAGSYTAQQIQDQLKRQKHCCYYGSCGFSKFKKVKGRYVYHVEHTFPLSRTAGSDIPANSIDYIVLSCPTCNLSKHDKFPWEFPEGGRLL